MKKAISGALIAIVLTGCASMIPQPRQVTLNSRFSADEVAWFQGKGTATLSGQAFFQTRGGQPRTCAGLEVRLQPESAYGSERASALYGNTESGFLPALSPKVDFQPDDATFRQTAKTTVCDAQGNFTFSSLPAGTYHVFSQIIWTVPGNYLPEGGTLMKKVTLADGEQARVILTP